MGSEVVIVGGGIIGLLLARELADAGCQVTLVERGALARESSWAGGGIVSPLYPWRYLPPVTALASWAQDFYPRLCAELRDETGLDPEYLASGLLMLAPEDEAEALTWSARHGRRAVRLNGGEARAQQPGIPETISSAVWMPEVAQVRPPRLTAALVASLRLRAKVRLLEHTEVLGFEREGARLLALRTAQGRVTGDEFVLCSGAWSGELGRLLGVELPIEPVRGQMLLFATGPAALQRMVMWNGKYLIPRRDGQILVGSTLERVGFDRLPTEAALNELYAAALAILPELADYPLAGQWAGLRPGSPDGIPYIGKLPALDNAWINAGHFRNGVVLAPAATRLLRDLLSRAQEPIVDPEPYAPATRRGL